MATKTRFWQITAAALLLINLGLLWHNSRQRPPHRPDALRNRVIDLLHLDAAQVQHYDTLIQQHRTQIRNHEQALLGAKKQLYSLLVSNDTSARDSLTVRIGQIQMDIEKTHFDHFSAVKQLCRPDQLADFQKITDEMLHFFAGPPNPPAPGK
jgi:periplasmic protein CpxP/Spy